jgi:hypothetical protein
VGTRLWTSFCKSLVILQNFCAFKAQRRSLYCSEVVTSFWLCSSKTFCGRHSAVDRATGYGLGDRGVRVRVPVGTRVFSFKHRKCEQSILWRISSRHRWAFWRLPHETIAAVILADAYSMFLGNRELHSAGSSKALVRSQQPCWSSTNICDRLPFNIQ